MAQPLPTEAPADALPPPKPLSIPRLIALIRPHEVTLVAAFAALVVGSGMTLAYPWLVGRLLDSLVQGAAVAGLNQIVLTLLGVFAVQSVFTFARSYLFTKVGERVVTDLRVDLYAALSRQEIAFFDERRTGELVSRLNSDTSVIQNTVTANISMAMRYGLQVFGGVAILIITSLKLTAVMLSVVPVVAVAAVMYGKRVRILSREVQDALAASSEIADETLSSIRTVRSFAREEGERSRYRTAVERSYELALKRTRVMSLFGAVVMYASSAAVALVLWYGGRLVVQGEMSVGELTSFVVYTLMVALAIATLTALHADFMKAVGAGERVFELIDRVPQILAPPNVTEPPTVKGEVTLERVSFTYPSRPDREVLHQVSLSLNRGEKVALVGPSGSGKSTIASLLPRFYDPQDGVIRFDGVDVKELDPDWLRRHIGVVSQEPVLFATSIAENIAYGRPEADASAIEEAAKAANAYDFVLGFPEGFQTKVGERGVRLSGGQKQRVAIARAILKDPALLILDEATSALDAESEHLVQEALERLMKNRTTLIIAHRLSTVRSADRVVVVQDGFIVESGRHEELMRQQGVYRRLVERQFAGEGMLE